MKQKPTILCIDDNPDWLIGLKVLLGEEYEVLIANSGSEGLKLHASQPVDAVILDYQMPGLTGRDVQRQLARAQIILPIIVVTAHDQAELREQCLADGAIAYLAKPLQRERLVTAIQRAIKPRAAAV